MPLTTIDGHLCIPTSEFGHFTTFLGLRENAMTEGRLMSIKREAEEVLGAKERAYSGRYPGGGGWGAWYSVLSYLPDEWLIKAAYTCIQPAYDSAQCQLGEESIDGEVWEIPDDAQYVAPNLSNYRDAQGRYHHSGRADLALIGPASLGGKIVLELCRRLAQFCYMDDAAARYHRNPPFSSLPAATLEENNQQKECFFHAEQHHEPVHADG